MVSLVFAFDESHVHDAVLVDESQVYSADSANSPPRLSKPLPDGTEARRLQTRDRWVELQLPDGRTGWVPANAVDIVTGK